MTLRKIHHLKCWPEPFRHVLTGAKGHEVRRADRDFRLGDGVVLEEWNPLTREYTGRMWCGTIGWVTEPATFGLPTDTCAFTLHDWPPGVAFPTEVPVPDTAAGRVT